MGKTLSFEGGPLHGQSRNTEVEDGLEDGWSGHWYEPQIADVRGPESRVHYRQAVELTDGWLMRVHPDDTIDLARRCYTQHLIDLEQFEQMIDWAMEAELLDRLDECD